MQEELFELVHDRSAERVLMSLEPRYYDMVWNGRKRYEFRRRYLAARKTTWFVYLTAPVSRLAAVIDLDTAIVATPRRIAELAEQASPGNGSSVLSYLAGLAQGFALPIMRAREYPGLDTAALTRRLGRFHPPQGYTLIDRHPAIADACAALTDTVPLREMVVEHRAPLG